MKSKLFLIGLALTAGAIAQAQSAGFKVTSSSKKSLTSAALASAEKQSAGSVNGKSVALKSSGWLVVRTGPESDMMSYRIKGVKNPNLVVKHGAVMHILFVNADDDMQHNLRFTSKRPPFDTKVAGSTVGSADLSHKTEKSFPAQQLVVTAPAKAGTYTYICTIPGHAAGGMYGTLIVK